MERCGARIMGVRVHIAPLSVIRYTGWLNGSAGKGVSLGAAAGRYSIFLVREAGFPWTTQPILHCPVLIR